MKICYVLLCNEGSGVHVHMRILTSAFDAFIHKNERLSLLDTSTWAFIGGFCAYATIKNVYACLLFEWQYHNGTYHTFVKSNF